MSAKVTSLYVEVLADAQEPPSATQACMVILEALGDPPPVTNVARVASLWVEVLGNPP